MEFDTFWEYNDVERGRKVFAKHFVRRHQSARSHKPTLCENMPRGKKKQSVTHFESTQGLRPKEFAKHFYRRDQSAPGAVQTALWVHGLQISHFRYFVRHSVKIRWCTFLDWHMKTAFRLWCWWLKLWCWWTKLDVTFMMIMLKYRRGVLIRTFVSSYQDDEEK